MSGDLKSSARPFRIGLYSDSEVIGGAERSMMNVIAAYRGRDELVVLSPSPVVADETRRLLPATPVHLIPASPNRWRSVLEHRRAFRAAKLDLLQVTLSNPFLSRPALLAGYTSRIPTVSVEQLVLPSRTWRGRVLKYLIARPSAAHVVVGNISAADLHRFFGLSLSSIVVIHNGVADYAPVPHRWPEPMVIGCAARLDDQKSLHLLIEAIAAHPGVHLVLVGDGDRRSDLERLARERRVSDRVRFVGWVDDARPYIAGFDIFALPSRVESFPLSIVESMLSGVPVIASDVGSVSDAVIHEETGLLIPAGAIEPLVAAIGRLIDDGPFRERIATAGRALAASRFTDRVMAEAYGRLWAAVLRGRPRDS